MGQCRDDGDLSDSQRRSLVSSAQARNKKMPVQDTPRKTLDVFNHAPCTAEKSLTGAAL
jgi:hypothetical protein